MGEGNIVISAEKRGGHGDEKKAAATNQQIFKGFQFLLSLHRPLRFVPNLPIVAGVLCYGEITRNLIMIFQNDQIMIC